MVHKRGALVRTKVLSSYFMTCSAGRSLPTLLFLALALWCAGLLVREADASSLDTIYWVSPSGTASWSSCRSASPLAGSAACSLATANANATAGNIIFLRGGTYSGQKIQPAKSGTSDDSRIVFTNFGGEEVLIRDSSDGVYLYKKSFITVNGINFYNLRRFFRIYASHYNIISYCSFDQRSPESGEWAGAAIVDDYNDNTAASESSTYNWVHHCRFFRFVYGAFAEHRGALLDIGSSDEGQEDESYYNLVEDCTFAYGGHHTLGVYSKYNVIRNNYFHNETNPDNWAYEGYRAVLTEGPYAGSSLYEGNRFGYAGASGLALRSARNILRFNSLYHCGSGAIQVVTNTAGVDHADYNHIYRNSFYHNGYLADYINFQGGMYFSSWGGVSPIGNVVKSNIFFDNKNGSIRYDGTVAPQIIANNWDQNAVDPGLFDLSGGDPDDPSLPDLRLVANSAAIDGGAPLTTVTSADGTGTTFVAADAGYFMDSWGIPGVLGDRIVLHGLSETRRIVSVNYSTQTITVDRVWTWRQGQGVSLVFQGTAPDIGAFEFMPIEPTGLFTLTPCRLLDTRVTSGPSAASPALSAGRRRFFQVAGACGVSTDARAVSANLTVVDGFVGGELRVTGSHLISTRTSILPIPIGRSRANTTTIQLALDGAGTVVVTNDSPGPIHLVLDVNGYFK